MKGHVRSGWLVYVSIARIVLILVCMIYPKTQLLKFTPECGLEKT